MSCLSVGYSVICSNGSVPGGVRVIYLANREDVDTFTQLAEGKPVTAITMLPTKKFYKVGVLPSNSSYTETVIGERGNTTVEASLAFTLPNRNQDLIEFVDNLIRCSCGLVAIWVEGSGKTFIQGLEVGLPFLTGAGEGATGTAATDRNAESLTLSVAGVRKAVEFTPGVAGIPV